MSKVDELKQAVEQLQVDVADLHAAENELNGWHEHDLRRRDGSTRQDTLHEEHGQELRDSVWHAKRKVESQKGLISTLLSAV